MLRKVRYRIERLGPYVSPRLTLGRGAAYTRDRLGRRHYRELSEAELLATRRSDTAFVFGSGRSLVEITPTEWDRIAEHQTISLREFPRQSWVRADYHVTGEVDELEPYARHLRENPLYASTIFAVQEGWLAQMGNDLVGRCLLPRGVRVFRYRRVRGDGPPSRSFRDGVRHVHNSITSATNFAVLMGFRRVVLAGVDLYNKEYFWLPAGEARTYERPGIKAEDPFAASAGIIDLLGRWRSGLEPEGISIEVYNPRSLLAGVLPVFSWDEPPSRAT